MVLPTMGVLHRRRQSNAHSGERLQAVNRECRNCAYASFSCGRGLEESGGRRATCFGFGKTGYAVPVDGACNRFRPYTDSDSRKETRQECKINPWCEDAISRAFAKIAAIEDRLRKLEERG